MGRKLRTTTPKMNTLNFRFISESVNIWSADASHNKSDSSCPVSIKGHNNIILNSCSRVSVVHLVVSDTMTMWFLHWKFTCKNPTLPNHLMNINWTTVTGAIVSSVVLSFLNYTFFRSLNRTTHSTVNGIWYDTFREQMTKKAGLRP